MGLPFGGYENLIVVVEMNKFQMLKTSFIVKQWNGEGLHVES